MQAADEIGDGKAGNGGTAIVAQRQAQHAGHRFEREIVRGAAGIGTVLAERA